tara:strand:- start:923 stop:1093 length:171 start_codon:yes stop_codon:yes gene_type:complete
MKLIKSKSLTEAQEFRDKFFGKNKNYKIKCNTIGEIISCESDDIDIIKYLKSIGLK